MLHPKNVCARYASVLVGEPLRSTFAVLSPYQ